jgi:cytochrome c553
LATYFSQQTPASPQVNDPALVAAGTNIFKNGIPATNVPACAACHGDNAGGNGAIPRLASQHAHYLVEQLEAFKSNSRANEMMHANAEHLTPQEISEVTAYLGSQ